MTPKAIANRIKAKGLTKLRWYCQMCNKACRDENGFKCHLTSDGHRRQMEIFGQAPDKIVDEYSRQFEEGFLEHLRRAHPFSRVAATVVYNDGHHVHMNSTNWLTLTDFVKYLGKKGICRVDETPKGWFMSLIQRDPAEEMDEKKRHRRERAELEEEERRKRELEAQIRRAREAESAQLAGSPAPGAGDARGRRRRPGRSLAFRDEGPDDAGAPQPPAKRSKLEELIAKDLLAKAAAPSRLGPAKEAPQAGRRSRPWLAPGITVKVMSKALQEHGYYKQKGIVSRVLDDFVGEIEMLDSGDIIRVDQEELETVIPAPGGRVLVVAGEQRGAKGTLEALDTGAFQALVLLEGEKEPKRFEYEHICKLTSL
ncbi:hypothetical protein QBZ16_002687 [Prototheca wickerhamii]|uniref:C2H2-type domain-containing protein n=1 Tax=Prototheca wickerhamii TaxID=3111 RepID=A0AAD9IMI0_PROWI|nr:hypothetical protein QBZ16_002687 [Prototheca wickerhamii]